MVEFTKRERGQLRRLASKVYEAEAHALLEELELSFAQWRAGEVLSSELLQTIHEFHQHQSRELWSVYQALRGPEIVARGLVQPLAMHAMLPNNAFDRIGRWR
ncbi:MAG: hypothetical protein ABWY12_13255, partial [Burkholderiales bacterium]